MSLAEVNFEDHVVGHLVEHGGYVQGHHSDFDPALALFPDDLIGFVRETQPDVWTRLVERHGSEAQARAGLLRRVGQELDNPNRMGVVDVLRHGVSDVGVSVRVAAFRPAHGLTPDLEAAYAANRLGVVRQVDAGRGEVLDLVLTVNGIPVATAELKNALTGQTTADAVRQYRTSRSPGSALLRRCAVHFAVDTDTVMMTTRLAGEETRFLPFNRGDGGRAGNPAVEGRHRTHYLWEEVWERDGWMDVLGRFVHTSLDQETGERATIFPRFHQWDAVRRLVADTRARGAGQRYLVAHSAGSGKSNTIAWLAHRLANLHDDADEKVFAKVVVVTDRTILDDQLADTIWQFEHARGVVARIESGAGAKSARLAEALTDTATKIVVVTLQTFPFVVDRLAELGGMRAGRFAVIADEAHSSQSGESAARLRAVLTAGQDDDALPAAEATETAEEAATPDGQDRLVDLAAGRGNTPNLSFYAFTATPKPRTRELFGTKVGDGDAARFAAFHAYPMRQAIEEGFILDVLANYVTYQTYWKIEKAVADDPSFDERRAKAAIARFVSLHPTNLSQKAEVIVDHFVAHTSHKIGGRAKAMVVTSSRLHAVRYKQAIERVIAERGLGGRVSALVAFSGQVVDPPDTHTESSMNRFPESETAERFDTDDHQVLVVAEKFQTGFDQPLLHTMFVDKVLTDLSAVQTLSRLNRTAPGKDDTFVLDFRNDPDDIAKAFAPYYDTAVGVPTDPNLMADDLTALQGWGVIHPDDVAAFAQVLVADRSDQHAAANALLDPAVDRWRALADDDQETFRDTLDRYVRLYAFLSLVVTWTDITFETWYLYGKALRRKITDPRADRVDISDKVALTHLRMDTTFEGGIAVDPIDEVEARWGRGPLSEEAEEALSVIVTEMNDRHGIDLTDDHRLTFDQIGAAMGSLDPVTEAARNNDNFADFRDIVFRPLFLATVINQMDANEEIFKLILGDDHMRRLFTDYTARTVYDRVRRE